MYHYRLIVKASDNLYQLFFGPANKAIDYLYTIGVEKPCHENRVGSGWEDRVLNIAEEFEAARHVLSEFKAPIQDRRSTKICEFIGQTKMGCWQTQCTVQEKRKFYVFVVGKLNVAKLANFPEINAFVLVACPENTLVDSREYFKPIVTPYELHLAVARYKEWSGDYITDFRDLLDELEEVSGEASDNEDNGDADDTPHYSMITGKLKQQRRYVDPRQNIESGSRDLVLANKSTEIAQ
ncbi:Diphthamide biosynthesis protein 2 [Coemansia sp. RSA 1933]|nr:Diphthamide biosynthesis protein 2 [Coemansia sp. RSA 1933]